MPNNRIKATGLAILLIGEFMTTLDVSIVNVALPSIGARLPASGSALVLVSAGYTLTYATLLMLGARLGDRYGHRRVFIVGVASFTFASLACGLAPNAASLVAARVLQGIGGALIAPQVLSIIQLSTTGRERARALGWYAAAISVGGVAGQLLGGLLTGPDGEFWRAVFLINGPVGVVLMIAAVHHVPATHPDPARSVDARGAALMSTAALAITAPLVLGPELGWPLWLLAIAAVGVVLAAGTILHLRSTHEDQAILNLGLLRHAGVKAGAGSLFATMAAYGGLLFSTMLLLQDAEGMSPLGSGLAVTPYILGFAATSLIAGRSAWGGRSSAPVVGLSATAVAYAAVGLTGPSGLTGGLALAVAGAGIGLGFGPVLAQVTHRVPTRQAADASGALTSIAQMGYLAGVAVLGTWFVTTAQLPQPRPASDAYLAVALAISAVALAAAGLAARLAVTGRSARPDAADEGITKQAEACSPDARRQS
ncbi:MFS transporter [Brevibacterium sp. S111]|uniref:MFS transporter n=1 Tax=Brevibacterium sp. S111 TaxID=2483795 RepID=UPI00108117A3|nr:MFS transporter [Brevibacterium sp. S111]TGD12953.1 MFS transporter [Brevibacterium sp. S111]